MANDDKWERLLAVVFIFLTIYTIFKDAHVNKLAFEMVSILAVGAGFATLILIFIIDYHYKKQANSNITDKTDAKPICVQNFIDEKNIDNLRKALLNAEEKNVTSFSDDIEDNISLQLIKKLAEFKVSKIESETSFYLSILGITAAFIGIGLSEVFMGISLYSLPKEFSFYYIKGGLAICFFGLVFAGGAILIYKKIRSRIDFFHHIILKIERRNVEKKES